MFNKINQIFWAHPLFMSDFRSPRQKELSSEQRQVMGQYLAKYQCINYCLENSE